MMNVFGWERNSGNAQARDDGKATHRKFDAFAHRTERKL